MRKEFNQVIVVATGLVDLRVPPRTSVQISTRQSARPIAVIFEATQVKQQAIIRNAFIRRMAP